MNTQGRITVPAAARHLLHVEGEAQFEWEVRGNELIFRPMVTIPREDAWAYTPKHLASVERARAQVRAGQVRQVTEADVGKSAIGAAR